MVKRVAKMASNHMKENFELADSIGALYTGGNVQLSKEASTLFCTCGDTINEIDIYTGKVVGEYKDDDDEVTSFAVSPDNKTLITASRSLLLHKFNVDDKTLIDRWKTTHKTPILSMVFDETSTLLATGSSDSTVKVYDSLKKYCTHNFKGSLSSVNLVKFHPDAEKLILFSAYDDGKIRMWDLKTSKCVCVFEGHFSSVTSLMFSRDNLSFMVSAGRDKVIIVWDLLNRKQSKTVPVYESIEGLCILPNSDGKEDCFISVGETGYLRKWTFPDVKCIYADPKYIEVSQGNGASSSSNLNHVLYSSLINQFISVTYDHNIVFHDVKSLKQQKQFIGYYDEIVDIKYFGPEQEYVAIATNSEQIKVVNHKSSTSEILCGHTGTVLSLDVSYDGKYIASSSKDNLLLIWCKDDNNKFRSVATGKGHTHHVGGVTWPKASTDYVVSCSKDLTVKCWILPPLLVKTDTVDLQVRWTEKGHDKDINVVSVSPNDKLVVSASQDKTAKIWKLKSGKLVGVLRGHKRGIWCAEFSPVDQCIVTGSVDATIKLWLLSNLTCAKTFEGHTNSVLRVYFINRGMQLISSSSEGLLKVWSICNDECVATVEGHDEKVWAMAVTKDEKTIVTGAADSTIKFWRDVTEETIIQQEKEDENKIKKEQEMMNLIQAKEFDKAVELAIMLNHPHRALKVFKLILEEGTGHDILQDVVGKLHSNYLENLLEYLCDWNTNARNSFITQTILSIVLQSRSADELLELGKIKEVIESLLPYTERHYERVKRLVHQSMFVNYSWESMKLPTLDGERESISEDAYAIE